MRKQENVIKYFTDKEIRKIFSTIEKTKDLWNPYYLRDLCVFHILYYCGLRASEIGLIRLWNYNPQTWELFVIRKKGSVNNTIRLDSTRKKILDKYIRTYNIKDSEKHLFISRISRPFSWATVTHLCDKYLSQISSIPDDKKHPHSFRHSCAIALASSGFDIKDLQYFLWHKRIESTMVYFSYTTSQMDDFYRKLEKNSKMAL